MKKGELEAYLSPLEHDVLKVLWKHDRMRVREIHAILKEQQKVACTSVAVILDRLHERGIVDRDIETGRGGLRYIYFPLKNKKELERSFIEDSVNKLIDRFGKNAVSYFTERFK